MTDWPKFVRCRMHELNVSERSLAAASGISRSTVRRFLGGKACVELMTVEELLQALGCSMTPTVTGKPHPLLCRADILQPPKPEAKKAQFKLIKAVGMGARF